MLYLNVNTYCNINVQGKLPYSASQRTRSLTELFFSGTQSTKEVGYPDSNVGPGVNLKNDDKMNTVDTTLFYTTSQLQ